MKTLSTEDKIIQAFKSLYSEKAIDKITVSEISSTAKIHRSTFYAYFTDTYDLLDKYESKLISKISSELNTLLREQNVITIDEYVAVAPTVFFQNIDDLYLLLSDNGDPSFKKKLINTIKPFFISYFPKLGSILNNDFIVTILSNVILSSLIYSVENKESITLEDSTSKTQSLIVPWLKSLL